MAEHVGRAGGKLILCGEHAVVHGHPAIALGTRRGTTVTLEAYDGPTVAPGDDRLRAALATVLPPSGWRVSIASDVPIGRGMGSSAALAVAVVRAWAAAQGRRLTPAEVHDAAFALERVFHGTPSGIDHAVAARGGVVRYRRTPTGPELVPLPVPDWTLVVLDSGTAGDTGRMVAGVTARRPGIDAHLERIGALVGEAEAALADPVALGPLLTENHALLRAIGVSTPELDRLVGLALDAGAHGAKLAGAGGGGVVIALVDDPTAVLDAAAAAGVSAFATQPLVPA